MAHKKVAFAVLAIISVTVGVLINKFFINETQQHTNDAYIRADISRISPQIAGEITQVLVKDNQWVRQGELLAVIDQREFNVALSQAAAQVQSALARQQDAGANLARQYALIAGAQAERQAAQAELAFAHQEQSRYQKMANSGAGSLQSAQQATARVHTLSANVAQAEAALKATNNMLQVLQAKQADSNAELTLAQAKKAMAELNLSYTRITAPIGGIIGKKSLRVGEFVKPGDALLAIVPQDKLYIIANYQETQLEKVAHGQPVEIRIDTFPDQTLKGLVDSIAPASGASFSAVAPENATGNFTKIVQRIPVKIVFDIDKEQVTLLNALRVGMSADVNINTLEQGL
ncbi:Inner membrane protein yiaV precursor [Serratia proteamaculans]|uniref:HlyD family secretion protein n=1 Tax=Serratia proteamaculans TaxID=28151 RepID=A0ABS0TU41_SERPR|nr:HlyD family secretion protein [Serratia proteamaculans]KAB1494072.1 HlyD family secretion protein [Serratia proteamaculans]MBI6180851.1 HlyD family secretion protein [Serratia proteamaculans]RYM54923.1 multidrug transporter EmrA [Serratia proteamaculans]CAI1025579.1 Inner membrane protein yiaV precursor [Serratia proteamaculans]CAI1135510.1 Inner membrane protein yiaV precursor [Serratia proteamaculans]